MDILARAAFVCCRDHQLFWLRVPVAVIVVDTSLFAKNSTGSTGRPPEGEIFARLFIGQFSEKLPGSIGILPVWRLTIRKMVWGQKDTEWLFLRKFAGTGPICLRMFKSQ